MDERSKIKLKSILAKLISKQKQKRPLINPYGRPKINLDLTKIKRLHEIGESNRQIAKKMNVSEKTIRNRLKEIYKL